MKKIVFTFGRMNPPTIGHQKLVDKVNAVAKSNRADARVYLSHTSVQTDPKNKKDPLNYNEKIRFAKKAFGNSVTQSNAKTIMQIAAEIEKDGYTDVILVVGSDRVPEFKKLLTKYNGKDYTFNSIKVVSAGERDPDAEGVEGMSASKLRALAKAGDFDTFKTGLPPKIQSDAKKIYDIIRSVIEETSMEELEERKALTVQQRLKRARILKRNMPKIQRARKIRMKRMATQAMLVKRSKRAAIRLLRKKVAGQKGVDYNKLGASQKITIDNLVAKKSAVVSKLAKRLLPKLRKAEAERLTRARSAKTEGYMLEKTEVPQDSTIKDREGTQPKKYFKDLSKSTKEKRDASFKAGKKASDDDPKAYKPAPGDAEAKTKTSKHTKKYRDMYGEAENVKQARERIAREKEQDKQKHDRILDRARTQDTRAKNVKTEEYELSESAEAALRKKSEKSGIPYGTLKKVYDRGMAAWKTGHRPGATQQQWGFARVNSFITKGKGTWGGADKDLAKGAKKESVDEACWDGYKQVGMKKKGDKMVPDCVPETKEGLFDRVGDKVAKAKRALANGMPKHKVIAKYHVTSKELGEASSPAQQAAIAISKKEKAKEEDKVVCPKCKGDGCDHCDNTGYHDKVNASHCMSEDWFTKLMNKYVLKPRTYKYAKEVLRQVLDKKKKEGKLNHSVEYYAQQIAKQYDGVDARDLASMVTEEAQDQNLASIRSKKKVAKSSAGAGEWGTPELTAKYKSETPGQGNMKESCCEECDEELIEEEVTIVEADGQKRKVTLNKPVRGGSKKFYVYVKNDKGNVVKVSFGDPNMEIKRDDPARRKAFRARHNCDNPGPKWKARYWSCKNW
jgi:nicotinic acid mononucleotide adenylyltransferase